MRYVREEVKETLGSLQGVANVFLAGYIDPVEQGRCLESKARSL